MAATCGYLTMSGRLCGWILLSVLLWGGFPGAPLAREIVVGGDARTEQTLLAEMTEVFLHHQGLTVRQTQSFGPAQLRQALERGQVDLYWEYTGAALVVYNGIRTRLSVEATYRTVKLMDAELGLVWLSPSEVLSGERLAMHRPRATTLGIETLSDLANALNYGANLELAVTPAFSAQPDGLQPLQQSYGFRVPREQIRQLDAGLIPSLLAGGQVDIGVVSITDPRLQRLDLVLLEDDRRFFPPYQLAPVVRAETLQRHPQLAALLETLAQALNNSVMGRLGQQVGVQRQPVASVARAFLQTEGLL